LYAASCQGPNKNSNQVTVLETEVESTKKIKMELCVIRCPKLGFTCPNDKFFVSLSGKDFHIENADSYSYKHALECYSTQVLNRDIKKSSALYTIMLSICDEHCNKGGIPNQKFKIPTEVFSIGFTKQKYIIVNNLEAVLPTQPLSAEKKVFLDNIKPNHFGFNQNNGVNAATDNGQNGGNNQNGGTDNGHNGRQGGNGRDKGNSGADNGHNGRHGGNGQNGRNSGADNGHNGEHSGNKQNGEHGGNKQIGGSDNGHNGRQGGNGRDGGKSDGPGRRQK